VMAGIERAGLTPGVEVAIAVDVAATQLVQGAGYRLAAEGRTIDTAGLLDELASFPVAQIGLDLRSRDTRAVEGLRAFKQTVVLGAVDARNTRVETEREITELIDRALRTVPGDRIWLAPTTGLEYLPHDVARRKLDALVSAARAGGVRV